MTRIDEMLGIDPSDPGQQNARQMVYAARDTVISLCQLRAEQGLTLTEVAERMNVPTSVLAEIENRTHDPRLSTLIRYALALGVQINLSIAPYTPSTQECVCGAPLYSRDCLDRAHIRGPRPATK